MPLVVPSTSDKLMLEFILGKKQSSLSQTLRLFQNNYIPTKSSILSEITEVTQIGYNPIILTQSDWSVDTLSNVTTATYPDKEFTLEETAVVYGYYVTVNINSEEKLFWLERFSNGPYELPASGGSITISLNLGST